MLLALNLRTWYRGVSYEYTINNVETYLALFIVPAHCTRYILQQLSFTVELCAVACFLSVFLSATGAVCAAVELFRPCFSSSSSYIKRKCLVVVPGCIMLGKTTALQYSFVTVHVAMPFAHMIATTTQYGMIPTQTRRRRVQGTGTRTPIAFQPPGRSKFKF